jgi:hypothetical protein
MNCGVFMTPSAPASHGVNPASTFFGIWWGSLVGWTQGVHYVILTEGSSHASEGPSV